MRNALERPDVAHFLHEIHLQCFVVVHHPDHPARPENLPIQGRAKSFGDAHQLVSVGGCAWEKVEIDRGDRRSAQRCRGVADSHRFQMLRFYRARQARDNPSGVHHSDYSEPPLMGVS